MSSKRILSGLFVTFSLFVMPAVQAHPIISERTDWFVGFAHPLMGLDHVLVMLAIGLWASQQGGNRLWQLPIAFLSMMMVGAMLAQMGWTLPMVEAGVASSLLIIGLLLTFAIRLSVMPNLLMVGLFAIFHGYVHAVEMPQTSTMFAYALGFVFSTGALHCLGIGLGLLFRSLQHEKLLRIGGFAIGLTGVWLWI